MESRPAAVVVTGPRYLRLATLLLQRMRVASPVGGIWEAADVQWWSRRERATDRDGQLFWLDERGEPLAAVILTDFGHSVQCDVLVLAEDLEHAVWEAAISRVDAAEFPVRADNAVGVAALTAAGWRPASEAGWGPAGEAGWGPAGEAGVISSWLEAGRRPQIPPLVPGYRLLSRAEAPGRPHPMIARNGARVEQRLRECSLYRPELDLMVVAPDGQAAGYGLFWADPVTGVGLVEPMRTEQAHQRRGIASHILAAGLDRLTAHGCRRLKVSNDIGLYLRAGFRPWRAATALIYARG